MGGGATDHGRGAPGGYPGGFMRCPNCKTLNPPNAKFCLECGNRLVVCPNCGTVNLPVAKFCIECGTPLMPKGESTSPLPEDIENEIRVRAVDTGIGQTQEMVAVSPG